MSYNNKSELIAEQLMNGELNRRTWGPVFINVKIYAKGDGTDQTQGIQNAINAAIAANIKQLFFSPGAYSATSLTNLDKLALVGDNATLTVGGLDKFIDDFSTATIRDYTDGREYLYYYHEKIRNKQTVKLIFSGDSTTEGVAITDANFVPHTAAKNLLHRYGVASVISINAGHSNMTTGAWNSTYLAADLAQNPDLYVLRWGLNDGGLPLDTRLESFTSALRSGLATIRATKSPQQMCIILMMPNSANDDVYNRNAKWLSQILPVVKQAARDYQCYFADTYNYMLDSTEAVWQDENDGIHIHPLNTANAWITSLISEALIPTDLRNYGVSNIPSDVITKASTDAPSTYAYGFSLHRSGSGFPYNGSVETTRNYDGILLQKNYSYLAQSKEGYATRRGISSTGVPGSIGNDAWSPWLYHYASETPTNLSFANSWVAYDAFSTPQYWLDGAGNVHLRGRLKSGTMTSLTPMTGALTVGYRPLQAGIYPVAIATGFGQILVGSDGAIKTFLISDNTWVSLDGVSFKAEQ